MNGVGNIGRKFRSWGIAYALIIPFLIIYILFLIYPAISAIGLSFTNADLSGNGSWVGLQNYIQLLGDPKFWSGVKNTLYFILLTVIPNTALGFVFALMVVRLKRFKGLVMAAFFLPNILPVSVVTSAWLWILDSNFGVFNYLLNSTISWFQEEAWAMPAVAFVTVWWTVGFNMLLFLSALQGIPREYYEAAELDGAMGVKAFLHITWPLVWPVTTLVLVLQLIAQFKIFDQVYLLTNGGPYDSTVVVLLQLYREAFQMSRGGYASAIAILLLVIILTASAVQSRLLRVRR